MIHQWVWVIIPLRYDGGSVERPYLCGYCRNCHQTITIQIEVSTRAGKSVFTKVDVPREGCEVPYAPPFSPPDSSLPS